MCFILLFPERSGQRRLWVSGLFGSLLILYTVPASGVDLHARLRTAQMETSNITLRRPVMNRYHDVGDRELVSYLLTGDQLAFEEIYSRYSAILFRYACDKTDRREDAEEIIQETFVWLWTKRETIGHVTELRPYLYGIVKHKIFNYIRHSLIRRRYAENYTRFESTFDNSNIEWNDVVDMQSNIDRRIAELPERCRTAFKLSRVDQLPIHRIAEEMKISSRTVENYITQALKHLRATVPNYKEPGER